MSLIGSLEQFDLENILRRIEVFTKTGLLVVKQENIWVEFYFRQGQLVCIGPMRTNATLIDRLLQAKLLSLQALPQIMAAVGAGETNETRLALTLINEGYLSREILRSWASQETLQVLQVIFSWPSGEVYFEDDNPTPSDRLLVALSVSSLLDVLAAPRSASINAPSTDKPAYQESPFMPNPAPAAPMQMNASQLIEGVPPFAAQAPTPGMFNASQLIEGVPPFAEPAQAPSTGFLSASQLIDDLPFNIPGSANTDQFVENTPPASFAPASAPSTGFFGTELDISASTQSSLIPPQPVANPLPPARIDTSFMTPELVFTPVDLSSIRERNPQVQVTPDQWRLFTLIDAQIPLQALCQMLMAPSEQVCVLAGELMAIGLIAPLTQASAMFNDPSTGAREYGLGGMNNNMQMSQGGSYGSQASGWLPQANKAQPGPFGGPIETQSQWGNGNNGATFMVGGGWVLSARQGTGPQTGQSGATYAPVAGYR